MIQLNMKIMSDWSLFLAPKVQGFSYGLIRVPRASGPKPDSQIHQITHQFRQSVEHDICMDIPKGDRPEGLGITKYVHKVHRNKHSHRQADRLIDKGKVTKARIKQFTVDEYTFSKGNVLYILHLDNSIYNPSWTQ